MEIETIKSDVGMSWDLVSLDKICKMLSGNAWSASKFKDEGKTPIIRIQNLGNNENEKFIWWDETYDEKFIVKKGDILLSLSGSIKVDVWKDRDALLNQRIVKLIPNKGIDHKWFFWQITNIILDIERMGKWALVNNVSITDLKELEIPLPPLATQKRIAEILDAADALRRKDQELLKKYDELAQAIFIEMFGDPVKNEKGWIIKRFDEISSNSKNAIVDGPFGSSIKEEDYVDDGIPIIRINNIRDEGYYDKGYKYLSVDKYNSLIRSKVEYNDILIARVGHTIGKTCIFKHSYKALLSTTGVAKATIDSENYNLNFINAQLNLPNYKKYIKSKVQGAGQPYLNLSMIKSFEFIIPSLDLQNKFSLRLLNLNKNKELMNNQIINSMNLFNVLIQKAFKGELV